MDKQKRTTNNFIREKSLRLQMNELTLESKVTLKQAYLIMFDYLEKHWEET